MVKLSIAQVVGLVIYHISHPQPEVYVYKFDRPQGFGAALVVHHQTDAAREVGADIGD